MGDEQVGQAEFCAQALEEVEDLGLDETSREDTASSQMITAGSSVSALAMATRWAWPPESWRGRRPPYTAGGRPTASSTSRTRRRRCSRVPTP